MAGFRFNEQFLTRGFTLTLPNEKFNNENFPNSVQSGVNAINNKGNTAGFYIDKTGIFHGYIKTNDKFKRVDYPNTSSNELNGRNNKGYSVGTSVDAQNNAFPYIYVEASEVFLPLSIPGAVSAQAEGINDSQVICGAYMDASGTTHGFLINSEGVITLDFPNSTYTAALDVNNQEHVVGFYVDIEGKFHGFLYINGKFQSIDDPSGIGTTSIIGINDHDRIVGNYLDSAFNAHGFVGTPVK